MGEYLCAYIVVQIDDGEQRHANDDGPCVWK